MSSNVILRDEQAIDVLAGLGMLIEAHTLDLQAATPGTDWHATKTKRLNDSVALKDSIYRQVYGAPLRVAS